MTGKRIILGEGEREYKEAVARMKEEAQKIEKIKKINGIGNAIGNCHRSHWQTSIEFSRKQGPCEAE